MTSLRRLFALAALCVGLSAGVTLAQDPNDPAAADAAAEGDSGNPLYGYVGTAFLGAGALFILCKSARR